MIDVRWINSLCEDFSIYPIFPYWCIRDSRTALEVLSGDPNGNITEYPGFIKHNALHDACLDGVRLIKYMGV